jgi:hypothetical protein
LDKNGFAQGFKEDFFCCGITYFLVEELKEGKFDFGIFDELTDLLRGLQDLWDL